MKRIGLISILFGLGVIYAYSHESIVAIPDALFLNALIEEGVDTNGDGLISYNEAASTSCLYLGKFPEDDIGSKRMNISDLTGIEAFINLDTLVCDYMRITELDLAQNQKLQYLSCVYDTYYGGRGNLTELDLSNNTLLKYLDCYCNSLESLDISNNPDLHFLNCGNNQISSLDVSENTKLECLKCIDNQLSSLDLSRNPELSVLECWNNQLSLLDLSGNIKMEQLICNENQLTALDVSVTPELKTLILEDNQVVSLNMSNNPYLKEIWCDNNQLVSLDLSGCRALTKFICRNNPLSLVCCWDTFLDDVLVVTEGSPDVVFTTSCGFNLVNIPDALFLNALIEEGVDSNGDGLICYVEAEAPAYLGVSEEGITDLQGVEAFINLDSLSASGNNLSILDISQNTALKKLEIENIPFLTEVCVWCSPFPPSGFELISTGSPNICFETDCNGQCTPDGIVGFFNLGVLVYPNPVNDLLTVELEQTGLNSIKISSSKGQELFYKETTGCIYRIDLSSFEPGVYFITCRSKDSVTTKKIIKL